MGRPELQLRQQAPDPATARLVDELIRGLEGEVRLARALAEALVAQRAAVAANQPEAVEASVSQISHLLLSLRDARQERSRRAQELTGTPTLDLDRLRDLLGTVPAALQQARADLQREAAAVAREATVNRGILQRVIQSGEAFLQELFRAAGPPAAAYGPDGDRPAAPGALLLNREA
jgi:hypothetical protein